MMIAVNGYDDGTKICTTEALNAKKNQRLIITLLDEEMDFKAERQKTAGGALAQYANPDLLPTEDGAWEKAVHDV